MHGGQGPSSGWVLVLRDMGATEHNLTCVLRSLWASQGNVGCLGVVGIEFASTTQGLTDCQGREGPRHAQTPPPTPSARSSPPVETAAACSSLCPWMIPVTSQTLPPDIRHGSPASRHGARRQRLLRAQQWAERSQAGSHLAPRPLSRQHTLQSPLGFQSNLSALFRGDERLSAPRGADTARRCRAGRQARSPRPCFRSQGPCLRDPLLGAQP